MIVLIVGLLFSQNMPDSYLFHWAIGKISFDAENRPVDHLAVNMLIVSVKANMVLKEFQHGTRNRHA